MSASPMARPTTEYKAIPKRILINDINDLPNDYSSTPGGTLYSTTPGGIYIYKNNLPRSSRLRIFLCILKTQLITNRLN